MSLFSISQSGDIFNRIGAIGDSTKRSCRLFATAKKRPRQPFWLPRAIAYHIFVACDDAAFEVYLDAVIGYGMADDASFSLIISTAGDILDIDAAAIVTAIDPRPEAE